MYYIQNNENFNLNISKCSNLLRWHHADSKSVGLGGIETVKKIMWTKILGQGKNCHLGTGL